MAKVENALYVLGETKASSRRIFELMRVRLATQYFLIAGIVVLGPALGALFSEVRKESLR
jgi:uncharacterized membrane protein YesL